MDNETRPKKRPASQDSLPDTERVTGSSSKKRRTSDGTTKRRRSSAETQSEGRSSTGSSSSPKRRRASTEPLSEGRNSADSPIKRSADSPVNSSTSSSSRKRRSQTVTESDRELNTRHQTSSDPEQEIKTGIRAASGPDPEEIGSLLEYIYTIPLRHKDNNMIYWMFTAVHILALDLVRFLKKEDAQRLYDRYRRDYPRWERLPAQKKTLKALKEAAA